MCTKQGHCPLEALDTGGHHKVGWRGCGRPETSEPYHKGWKSLRRALHGGSCGFISTVVSTLPRLMIKSKVSLPYP